MQLKNRIEMKALTIYLTSILFVLGIASPVVADSALTAHQTVEVATERLIQKLKKVIPIYEKAPETFYQEVDSALEPYIDFEGFARGVMAKYYKKSSDEQRKKFADVFRGDLIRTYGKSLVEFDNEKIIVLPEEGAAEKPGRRRVNLEIHSKSGRIYPVEYAMRLKGDVWKLRNVVVNGINLGLTFRNHFSRLMRSHKGNIDLVIENWSSEVEIGG